MFYSFPSNQTKIGREPLIGDTSRFFVTQPMFSYDLTLSRYNFPTEAGSAKPIIFSESWVRKVSLSTGPEIFPLEIFVYLAFYQKIHFFAKFRAHT